MQKYGYLSQEKTRECIETKEYNIYHPKTSAKVVEVILVTTTEGGESCFVPFRTITRYFTKDGKLICKLDPIDDRR